VHILYLSAAGGGHETNVRVLAPALINEGHQVSILYLHPISEVRANERQNGVSVYHTTYGDWHYYFNRLTLGVTRLPLLLRSLEAGHALKQKIGEIHKLRPLDIVELPEVALPRNGLPVPYVVRLHSSAWMCRRVFEETSPWTDSVEASQEARTLRRAATVTSPSNFVASYIRGECCLPDNSIQIIPYPVDTDEFKPAAKDRSRKSVLFVGRVEKRKGAEVLMRAIPSVLAQHPDCEFTFVGEISDELEDLVKAAPGAVRFLSFMPRRELVELYQHASVCVVPSLWDNSPNVVYEAMACGTPIVASRVGGIPELVDDGVTGVLIPPRDEQSLAEAINILLNDYEERARMADRAREKALAEWRVDGILNQTLETYERVVRSR
jgi:glycosyltransferase involved in cell wall biosynthesis